MKTTNETLTAPEEKTSKAALFFTALVLAALMVSAVVGGAAFMIYRQFSAMPSGAPLTAAHTPQMARLNQYSNETASGQKASVTPMNRPVSAESSDRSDYRYADNTVLSPAAARRVIAAWKSNPVVSNVPPPLTKTPEETSQEIASRPPTDSEMTGSRPPLNDPQSRYIVNPITGRIVGVDGSAGAAAEARLTQAIPVAVAVHTPPMEVRVATPVQVRAAIPVIPGEEASDIQPGEGFASAAQYPVVRRAQPVTANSRSFDAASYLARQDDLRGQLNVNPTSRAAGYRHDYRLSDAANR